MARKSVFQVCDYGGAYAGNFIPAMTELGAAVRDELGLDQHFVFSQVSRGQEWLQELEAAGLTYSFLESGMSRRDRVAALGVVARERDAALLHSHFTRFDLDCAAVARSLSITSVWHMHSGFDRYGLKRRLKDVVKVRMLGRYCDRVIAVSDWVGELARMRGFPKRKVEVVRNGIVLERFAEPDRSARARVRKALGVEEDAVMLLSFCWDAHRKGADLIIRAGQELLGEQSPPPVAIVLVGYGGLESFIQDVLDGRPTPPWLTATEQVADVLSLYGAADAFISAARHEGFSYAIGEAMTSGLPVVMSDIPATSFYLRAEGVIPFRSGDAEALGSAVGAVISSDRRGEWAEANRRFAREHLGIGRWVEGIIGVYGRLLQDGRRSPQTFSRSGKAAATSDGVVE